MPRRKTLGETGAFGDALYRARRQAGYRSVDDAVDALLKNTGVDMSANYMSQLEAGTRDASGRRKAPSRPIYEALVALYGELPEPEWPEGQVSFLDRLTALENRVDALETEALLRGRAATARGVAAGRREAGESLREPPPRR